MQKKAAVFLQVRSRDGLASRTLGVEGRGPQHDVFAVECAVALADRHRRLPRVIPHGCEAIGFRIEAGDSRARARRPVSIDEGKIGLQKLAVLDHVLLARCFRYDRLPVCREERLHHIPIPGHLREQLLASTRRVRRLILIVGLLRDRRSRDKEDYCNPFRLRHGTR